MGPTKGVFEKRINCRDYYEGVCSHPSARGLFSQKPCILIGTDSRPSACRYQTKHCSAAPPSCPPPKSR